MISDENDQWRWQVESWTSEARLREDDYTVTICAQELEPALLGRVNAAIGRMEVLFARCVASIIAARTARLNWRDGPNLTDWSPVELRLEADGNLWLSLHEYETDEYSLWLVGLASDDTTPEVFRRVAWMPDGRPFHDRGVEF